MYRGWKAATYILKQMIPILIVGVLVFVAILLMFQTLRLTEFALVHGVNFQTIVNLMLYLSISFLPAILPMGLLFAVIMTYSRMSNDSEIVAFKAIGLDMKRLSLPALVLGIAVGVLSAKVSFQLAPWGNRQFELLIAKLGQTKASISIKEGVFSEGFFDLVVYANKVDSKNGLLGDVFIFDERDSDLPLTIIAREGQMIQDTVNQSQTASIRLIDGNIHRSNRDSSTKIDFMAYDLNLSDPIQEAIKEKSVLSLTLAELRQALEKEGPTSQTGRRLTIEYHKRLALSIGCILFALIGVGLGTTTNRRNARSGSMVTCLAVIVGYWVSYMGFESIAVNGLLRPQIAMWSTNLLLLLLIVLSFRSSSVRS